MFRGEGIQAAQIGVARRPAHLYGKAYDPVGEKPAGVHEEVHHVRVVRVLHAGEPGLHHGETGLHEHDEEAGDQRPDKVDGDLVLADLIGHIREGYPNFRVGSFHIVDRSGDGAARIALLQVHLRRRLPCSVLEFGICWSGWRWRRRSCGGGCRSLSVSR